MTTEIPLNQNEVSEFEPSIQEGSARMMLSADAVPRAIVTQMTSDGFVSQLEFRYGGMERPTRDEMLDSATDPRVTITPGQVTEKVIKLVFGSPTNANGLIRVAERLKTKATSLSPAKRLSFQMTATLLEWMARRL